uniref:Uncharacterized protein n=1 Tax=Cajanus cajan TaxID=3821 RepID=A0A151SQM5_CAJCA|nr:hypothetical protein KK1_003392 [Cajanus cajan]
MKVIILVQQRVAEAFKGESKMSRSLLQKEKNEMIDKVRSVIIWYLREVAREKTVVAMWVKLESLYMTSLWQISYVFKRVYPSRRDWL